jgi:phosphohistidine swiveling domain-containing protein
VSERRLTENEPPKELFVGASEPVGFADRLTQSSEPGRLWSRNGTASEIHPNILSPMCWSFWEDSLEYANRQVFVAIGVLPASELTDIPKDPNVHAAGCFYGRLAVNVDRMRDMFGLLPGVSADDFERDFLGSVRPGLPKQRTAWSRIPVMAVKLPIVVKTVNNELQRVHANTLAWWKSEVLNAVPDDPLRQLEDAKSHFTTAISVHIRSRFLVQIAQSALAKFAVAAGDPRLANDVVAGLGETVEAFVAEDLWRLSRDEITLEAFLERHGYHGPYESHMYTYSWRERPERVRAMAASFARREDVGRPEQDEKVAQARTAAADRMIQGVSPLRRPLARAVIRWSRNLFRNIQLGHSGYAMCIDGGRFAAREVGRRLVERGAIDEVDDVFFLTIEELRGLHRDRLPLVRDVVAHRRAQRAEYEIIDLPRSFEGNPIPVAAADSHSTVHEPTDVTSAQAQAITGLGVSDGTVVGRARVLIDIDEDLDLDEGDILVCGNTDPSWTSIMALASGLVVDMGGSASHAAIVAREMGIVCVVGTGNGTKMIPEGATIEVDGTAGTVTVVTDQRSAAAP